MQNQKRFMKDLAGIKGRLSSRFVQLLVWTVLALMVLTACGRDNKLNTYKTNMENFFDKVSSYNETINAINPDSADAKKQLLSNLDGMNQAFQEMASYEVPEAFSLMGDLPTEAAGYMKKAVDAYHTAYDGEYDAESESLARQYYERANSSVQYIIDVLHGKTPSGEGVTIIKQEDHTTKGS